MKVVDHNSIFFLATETYEFGDLSNEVDKRVNDAIEDFTGKEVNDNVY